MLATHERILATKVAGFKLFGREIAWIVALFQFFVAGTTQERAST